MTQEEGYMPDPATLMRSHVDDCCVATTARRLKSAGTINKEEALLEHTKALGVLKEMLDDSSQDMQPVLAP